MVVESLAQCPCKTNVENLQKAEDLDNGNNDGDTSGGEEIANVHRLVKNFLHDPNPKKLGI